MLKKSTITLLIILLFVVLAISPVAEDWAIKADYTESCSCGVPCPCTFGSAPTRGHCHGNGLIEIESGNFGDVKLDGVSFVMAFSLGQWVKFYINEEASDEQFIAMEKLFNEDKMFGAYMSDGTKILAREKVPVTVERNGTLIKYMVPASTVEIDVVTGLNGNPIKIKNLPMLVLNDHTQYKSIVLSHKAGEEEFSYEATNGLTSKIIASSDN